ncbi:MAG: HAD family hydrolase [Desulfovibrio sp.]|jgi:phosphoglycolate phosphatase-like HAD superfamily hydrolase|nr:HAD family hydrolase [Desulfovibrio sp.]
MPLALVVFDCDGVLLESVGAKTLAFKRIGAEFGPEAADRLTRYHILHSGVSRSEKFAWFFEEVLGRRILPEEDAALCSRFAGYCLEEVCASPLVPGIREVLDLWHGRVPLYVASGTPQAELADVLTRQGLARYFAGLFGSPPGKADLLRGILDLSGACPKETVMVGDSRSDYDAAEKAGTLFYGRGAVFRSSGCPWHTDLTRLNSYLESLARNISSGQII